MSPSLPAIIFTALTLVAALFQLALAAGAPWGRLTMGGRYPGALPNALRAAAVVQAVVLILLATMVLVRARVVFPEAYGVSTRAIWAVVGFCVLSSVLNLITPSRPERAIWAPVTLSLLACSVLVAVS